MYTYLNKIRLIALILAAVCIWTSLTYAGTKQRIQGWCATRLEPHFQHLVEANEEETLLLHDKDLRDEENPDGQLFGLTIGKRLGSGYFGQVAVLEAVSDPDVDAKVNSLYGNRYLGLRAVKIPHAIRYINLGRAFFISNNESQKEYLTYGRLFAKTDLFLQHPSYPKNPAFKPGVMPVAPILGTIRTERGLLIVKPMIRGLGLKQLAKLYHANGNKWPDEILEGLRNHYQFIQSVYHVDGQSSDIRPPNLVWLPGDTPEDRAQLELLGYTRPGIMSFELAEVPANEPQYIDLGRKPNGGAVASSFEDYLIEFTDAVLESERQQ